MKNLILSLVLVASPILAQNYTVDWFTIDGGGGTGASGGYTVSGTIGQPDASGLMTAGSYLLTGGFWSFLAVAPGNPLLTIRLTATNTAIVSWPSPSAGFVLQQTTNLATSDWTAPPEVVSGDGTNRFIIVNPFAGTRFYRLSNP